MTKKSLHTSYFFDDDAGAWRSLRPHRPGKCWGKDGAPCPKPTAAEPCTHRHSTGDAANRCSQNREPFA